MPDKKVRPLLCVFYFIPEDTTKQHAVPKGSFREMIPLEPITNKDEYVVGINLGEIVPRIFKPSGESAASPKGVDVARWCERFTQTLLRAVSLFATVRRNAPSYDASATTDSWDDPDLSALAGAIADACETGTLLLAVGLRLGVDAKDIENFLLHPIALERTNMAASECARRIQVRFAAQEVATAQANRAAAPHLPFVPSPFQKSIIDALNGRAMRTDALAAKIGDRRKFFREKKELEERGLVAHHQKLGFYRPDAPPPELSTPK